MRTSAAGLVLGFGLVLTGCSAEAEPEPLPAVPSSSPTAAPVPSPPVEAAAETADGASAFARYYLALIGDAYTRGNTEALRAASAPGCGGCDSIAASVDAVAAKGQRRVSGSYVVKEVAAPPLANGEVTLLVDYARGLTEFSDSSGKVVATTPPVLQITVQMRIIRRSGGWLVQGYRVVSK